MIRTNRYTTKHMRRWSALIFGILLVTVTMMGIWQSTWDFSMIEEIIRAHPVIGALIYMGILISSVVLLPLSSLPLVPLAVQVFGVTLAAVLSILSWWIGALIAFQIARLGRTYMERFTTLTAVDRLEQKIPKDISFAGIILLRMVLPVDITSFALGLLKHLPFSTYAVASLIGIIPFAFVLCYAGGELVQGRYVSFILIIMCIAVAVMILRRLWGTLR